MKKCLLVKLFILHVQVKLSERFYMIYSAVPFGYKGCEGLLSTEYPLFTVSYVVNFCSMAMTIMKQWNTIYLAITIG